MPLKLIKNAYIIDATIRTANQTIYENFRWIADDKGYSVNAVYEGVTHVLAGLGQSAQNMNPNSVASFLAGVEKLSEVLITIDDVDKKRNTLKVLTAAAMKYDDLTKQALPNSSVVKIAQFGSKFPDLVQKYVKMATSVDAPVQIDKAARALLSPIERSMNMVSQAGKTIASNPSSNIGR
jgi:hypothetical protein